jgi:outer membrane protein assembly factor BamD
MRAGGREPRAVAPRPGSRRRSRWSRLVPVLCATFTAVAGCGGPRVSIAPTDPLYEFRAGLAENARHHWVEAQEHLKRFLDLHPGHANADSAQYELGLAKMGAHLYPEAAVEFQILGQEYPRSPLRSAASFQECVSYVKQVHSTQLDPTPAIRAQTCFEEYMLRFPGAADSVAAVAHLRDLADHLAEKDLRLGRMFVRMKKPRAARVYLASILHESPGTRWAPDALLYLGQVDELDDKPAEAAKSYRRVVMEYAGAKAAKAAREHLAKLVARHPELAQDTAPPAPTPNPPPAPTP